MSFTEPLSVTIGGVTTSLARVSSRPNGTSYQSGDGLMKVTADHAYGRRTRRVIRLDLSKISADVFLPSTNVKQSMSNYMVFDTPAAGFTPTEVINAYIGFKTMFSASSELIIARLLGGES